MKMVEKMRMSRIIYEHFIIMRTFTWNAFLWNQNIIHFFVLSVFSTVFLYFNKKNGIVAYDWSYIWTIHFWTRTNFSSQFIMMMECVQISIKYPEFAQLAHKRTMIYHIIYDKLMKAQESNKHDHSVCKNVFASSV